MRILVVVLVFCSLALASSADGQSWTLEKRYDCGIKDANIQCEISGYDYGINAKLLISLKNKKDEILLTYDEYHSVCYSNGTKVISANFGIPVGKDLVLPMLSNRGDISCIEGWISQCHKAGVPVDCGSVIKAEVLRFKGNKQ
jgi:hypothetical protein